MPSRTVAEHVEALLSRQITEGKLAGAPRPDLEASSVFDSIALNLMLKPRAALYFAMLARNGLLATVRDEIAILDALSSVVNDLGNASFKIEGAPVLRRAYSALVNLETLPSLDAKTRTTSISVSLYGKAVSEFLNVHLAKNVKQRGSTSLLRPGQEASQDMPVTLAELRAVHAELLDRMYLLASGIPNFESAPFGAVLGSATVSRAKKDLAQILSHVESGGDPSASRDFAVRLIGSRAAISTIAQPPGWDDPLLPAGTVGTSGMASANAVTAQGPFTLTESGPTQLSLEVCGEQGTFYFFPGQVSILVGQAMTFPLTLPSGTGLFVTTKRLGTWGDEVVEDWRLDVAGTWDNLGQLCAHMMGQVPSLYMTPFASYDSRMMIYSGVYYETSIQCTYAWPIGAIVGITVPMGAISTKSAHAELGYYIGQVGKKEVSSAFVAEAIHSLFPTVNAEVGSDNRVYLSTVSQQQGAYLKILSAPSALELSGVYRATTSTMRLGSSTTDQRTLVQVGDELKIPDAFDPGQYLKVKVDGVSETELRLSAEVPTFIAPVTGTSAIVAVYRNLATALRSFLAQWSTTPYVAGMERIDKALAPLITSQSPAQRNVALDEIEPLRDLLNELLNLLGDDSTMLPAGAGKEERKIVEGILTTLAERHFLRAADLLLKCDLQSILGMDSDRASYGGAFLSAASTFAHNSLALPGEESGSASDSVSY